MHSLWPGPCKVRPPYQIWWGLVQRCGFLYRTHTHTHKHTHTHTHRFNFIYKIKWNERMQKASLLHGADREICCLGSAPLRVTIVIAYDLAPCKIRPPYQIWWGLSRSFCWTRRTRTVSNREPLTRFWTARWWKYELMDPARRYKSRANYGK